VAFQQGDLESAAHALQHLLDANPDHFEALHLLGVIAGLCNDPGRAVELFRRAVAVAPKNAMAYSNLGSALNALGQFDSSLKSCERALKLKPDYSEAHNNRGNALVGLGRVEEAIASFDRAIALRADYAEAHNNRGNALMRCGRLEDAVAGFDRAIAIAPDFAEVHNNRGNALAELKQTEAAIASYDRAIARDPDYAEAHNNRGIALLQCGQYEAAIASFDRAISLDPSDAEAYRNRGQALHDLGQLKAAVASYDRSIVLDPQNADAFLNRGVALHKLRQFEAALASFNQAVTLETDDPLAYFNRGIVLQELQQLDAAMASFDRAIELRPDYAEAYWNKALTFLLGGDFERGWDLYEWRLRSDRIRRTIRSNFRRFADDWNGNRVEGSLLVLPEQGIGDQIFYAGMLSELRSYARAITVCLDNRLVPLFTRSFEHIYFRDEPDIGPGETFDFEVSLPELGRFFRRKPSDFAAIRVPYLFADKTRSGQLRSRLKAGTKCVCGLSWTSKNLRFGADKSLGLEALAPLLTLPGIDFVDLQYGDTSVERAAFFERTGVALTHLPDIDNLNDIDGLAALIDACDLVLTVSNTTAHLAAALGKPVFVMLPRASGLFWYWHLGRSDSPWYPTARLYRQEGNGDWAAVIERIQADLRDYCSLLRHDLAALRDR